MKDRERFDWARRKIIGTQRDRKGIGTLSEKTVHAILKLYYSPDVEMHEIPIKGSVADIFTGTEVIEIQTGNFDKLRAKLDKFLELYPVTIVYPIPHEKWLIWVDEETGEFSKKRKSPLKGSAYMAFRELYKIKSYLTHENLRLKLILMNVEEYRLLNGWSQDKKKGSTRFDRLPVELVEEIEIDCPKDYLQLIPYDVPEPFSVKEFSKIMHINQRLAQIALHIFGYVGVVERVGKKGNAFLYRIAETYN